MGHITAHGLKLLVSNEGWTEMMYRLLQLTPAVKARVKIFWAGACMIQCVANAFIHARLHYTTLHMKSAHDDQLLAENYFTIHAK